MRIRPARIRPVRIRPARIRPVRTRYARRPSVRAWLLTACALSLALSCAGISRAADIGAATRPSGQLPAAGLEGASPLFAGIHPLSLVTDAEPESVYAPPAPPREDEGVNEGGVHFDLNLSYLNRYLYRGVIRFENQHGGNSLNFQADGKLSFDLGTLPHPFIEAFTNIDDADTVSRFQEVRPTAGFDWNLKPFLLSAGYIDYLFPEREKTDDTQEVFVRLAFDDSTLFRTDRPLFTPYIFAAYDFDRYNGWYFEGGVSHDFPIEDTGIKFTLRADVAGVLNNPLYRIGTALHDTGFQHYDLALIGTYSLNNLFNVSKRYGEFDLKGYLYYTDGLTDHLRADTQLWGGVGLGFSY